MSKHPEHFIIKDYITEKERVFLLKAMLKNVSTIFPGFVPINVSDSSNEGEGNAWDPNNKILQIARHGYEFLKNQYDMEGRFGINRSYGTILGAGPGIAPGVDDSFNGSFQKIYTCILSLNDNYKGGEYFFWSDWEGKEVAFKTKARSLIYFPSYKTISGIAPITSGTRVDIMFKYFDAISDEAINASVIQG